MQIEMLLIEIIGALVVLFLQLVIDSALWMFVGAVTAVGSAPGIRTDTAAGTSTGRDEPGAWPQLPRPEPGR
ncbi:hypothetical protein [Streptomyces sp. NPDC056160]|uniref:hypothetical protein n=1 Tax=Streptomyces sp. NPDC056160 TaxID=3345731 RepID=UPI0035E181E1